MELFAILLLDGSQQIERADDANKDVILVDDKEPVNTARKQIIDHIFDRGIRSDEEKGRRHDITHSISHAR
jgi:hypothetical protein